jgi:hypothetical protein
MTTTSSTLHIYLHTIQPCLHQNIPNVHTPFENCGGVPKGGLKIKNELTLACALQLLPIIIHSLTSTPLQQEKSKK